MKKQTQNSLEYPNLLIFWLALTALIFTSSSLAAPSITRVSAEPVVFSNDQNVTVTFQLDQSAQVTLSIYDARGYLVWIQNSSSELTAGDHQLVWEGATIFEQPLIPEAYYYTTYGNRCSGSKQCL